MEEGIASASHAVLARERETVSDARVTVSVVLYAWISGCLRLIHLLLF